MQLQTGRKHATRYVSYAIRGSYTTAKFAFPVRSGNFPERFIERHVQLDMASYRFSFGFLISGDQQKEAGVT